MRAVCDIELSDVEADSVAEVGGALAVPLTDLWRENLHSLQDIKIVEREVTAIRPVEEG
jgi:hypothetical protein